MSAPRSDPPDSRIRPGSAGRSEMRMTWDDDKAWASILGLYDCCYRTVWQLVYSALVVTHWLKL
ncbi:hypothetical protein RHECNPAF_2530075 [Rhizobium etli CNPAF512]|nr:hypothetical protein RHECNPAF_2530075 [Rhizobium etli CNPAF512]